MTKQTFRAYTSEEATRSFATHLDDGTLELDKKGRIKRRQATWPIETVAFTGKAADGKAEFDAGDTPITRVVFYEGDGDAETVLANIDLGRATGAMSVALPPEEEDEDVGAD